MEMLSTLGDIGFVIPVLTVALLMLTALRDYTTAMRWGGAFLVAVISTAVLKTQLRGSAGLPHFPSGHVAVAVSFYGGLLAILWGTAGRKLFALFALAGVAALVGWSRVELTEHTWIDVVGGYVVGTLALAFFGCLTMSRPVRARSRVWLVGGVVAALPAGLLTYPWLGHTLRTLVE